MRNEGNMPSSRAGDDDGNGADPSNARREQEREEAALMPPVDVVEDKTGIALYADLPDAAKDRLDVHIEADSLVIEGELGLELPAALSASHAEVQATRYRRTFTLSKELDASKTEAAFQHGVLRIRIPKSADVQPRRMAVQVH